MLHLTTNKKGEHHFVVTADDEQTILAMFAPAADKQGAIDVLQLAIAEIEKAIAAGQALRERGPDSGDTAQ